MSLPTTLYHAGSLRSQVTDHARPSKYSSKLTAPNETITNWAFGHPTITQKPANAHLFDMRPHLQSTNLTYELSTSVTNINTSQNSHDPQCAFLCTDPQICQHPAELFPPVRELALAPDQTAQRLQKSVMV